MNTRNDEGEAEVGIDDGSEEGSDVLINEDGIEISNSPAPQQKKPKVYLKPLPLDKLKPNGSSSNVPLKPLPVIGANGVVVGVSSS